MMKTSLMVVLSCMLLLFANPCQADVTNYVKGSGAYSTTATRIGQSWTADSNGRVQSIRLMFGEKTASDFILYVYRGKGISGTKLLEQSVSISQTGITTIPLTGAVNVASGSQYTFYLVNPTTAVQVWKNDSSTYAGGEMYIGSGGTATAVADKDLYFGIIMVSGGASESVPAATPWQYGLLALLLAGCGLAVLRQYRRN